MTLVEIRWICELFEKKNMSKAAGVLYVSQPALSQCLQRVERQLGFPLFHRSNKGLVPTEKGSLFHQAAASILDTYDRFLAQAELLDLKKLNHITIGMAPYISSCCSVEIIQKLCGLYPDIRFKVYEAYTPELIQALENNTIQLMVTSTPACPEGTKVRSFGTVPCVIFLRKGSQAARYAYMENQVPYLDPKYLKEEPFCITYTGQATRLLAENLLAEAGISPTVIHESRHISSLYRYAQQGIATGIATLTPFVQKQDCLVDTNLIYRIPPAYRWSHAQMVIYTQAALERIMPARVYDIISQSVSNFICLTP